MSGTQEPVHEMAKLINREKVAPKGTFLCNFFQLEQFKKGCQIPLLGLNSLKLNRKS